jgi:hypothetical protein
VSGSALAISLLCLTVLAACGSSGTRGATNASANAAIALTQCMHSHGVSNFPDPTTGPGGSGFPIASTPGSSTVTVGGIAFSGPAFQGAEKACRLFGGGRRPPPISEAQKEGMLTKARCIRKHGVPNFPDPMFAPGGYGAGVNLPPNFNPNAPVFRRARQACANIGTRIPGSAT